MDSEGEMTHMMSGRMVWTRALVSVLCLAVTACDAGDSLDEIEGEAGQAAAPVLPVIDGDPVVPGEYVVVLHDRADVARTAADLAQRHKGTILVTYHHALRGFAIRMPDQAVGALRKDPRVAMVDYNRVGKIDVIQTGATWGLDRVDERNRPLGTTYSYASDGTGVTVYIIDSGLRTNHVDFGTRASIAYDAWFGTGSDGNGHGTHVAGTIGGSTWGVAKNVTLRALKVCDYKGDCPSASVVAAVDWVTANHVARSIANISLGYSSNAPLDLAVTNSINSGVTYAISAGNDSAGTCKSPSSVVTAIAVGATDSNDVKSSFSNYGSCIDMWAPGTNITSAAANSTTGSAVKSGTSMASPHVAGAAALWLQNNPTATPAQVKNGLISNASANVLTGLGTGSPNRLLNVFPTCGNGVCGTGENALGCNDDCPTVCGDGLCTGSETWQSCFSDCPNYNCVKGSYSVNGVSYTMNSVNFVSGSNLSFSLACGGPYTWQLQSGSCPGFSTSTTSPSNACTLSSGSFTFRVWMGPADATYTFVR
jgi:subtilisin family serine protease